MTTPFVAFVDTDVDVPAGWLAGLIGHFGDDRVALVAPRVRSTPGGNATIDAFEDERGSLDLGDRPARGAAGPRVS